MRLWIPVQVCSACCWVGPFEDTVRKVLPDEEATVACPRCKEYTETAICRVMLGDIVMES